jgi:hypothetical protein
MEAYLDWSHLKQVWRVERDLQRQDRQIERENHYDVTNLHRGLPKATPI